MYFRKRKSRLLYGPDSGSLLRLQDPASALRPVGGSDLQVRCVSGEPYSLEHPDQTGDHAAAFDRIAGVYSRLHPDGAFDASFIEDQITDTFSKYTQLQKIIIIFTVIAIFVSSLGLFAMSTYYIRARSRNIAVQKVFGADKRLVLRQIVISYLMLSLIAFVVSVPVSWLLTSSWLNQFSYSTGAWLQWLLILASGVLSCAVAFLTVLYQSIVAINTNPVIALRKED